MKKVLSILLLISITLSLALSFASCKNGNGSTGGINKNEYKTQTKEISFVYFNTVSIISSYGAATSEEFNSYVKVADELLGKYHKLFDIYYEYSGVNNIRTINKNAGKSAVAVDAELIEFLEYCKELYTLTNQKTNIMLGSVLSIWHDHREAADTNPTSATVPSMALLTEAAKHTSIDSLVIDKQASTVYISDPEASIDVGAIGKGYAAEKLYKKLVSLGADCVALNVGGNLRTIGTKPDGELWTTGITNPDKSSDNTIACRVKMGDTSLVTSGDYERYYYVDGVKYHHIIDPATLMPADYFASVSIFTKDSGLADALSTALFCMSYEEGLELVNNIGNIEVIWIYSDGTIKSTNGVQFINK